MNPRKNSPQLKEAVDAFVAKNKKGSLHGNILLQRHLKQNTWARNSLSS